MTDKSSIEYEIKRTINKVVREKGHFPSPQEMCAILSYSAEQTGKYMAALAEEGYLEKIGDWYRFPELKKTFAEELTDISLDKVKEQNTQPTVLEKKPLEDVPFYETVQKISEIFSDPVPEESFIESHEPIIPVKSIKKKTKKRIIAGAKVEVKETSDTIEERVEVYNAPVKIIQFIMGIIGIGASIVSIYFTFVWMKEFLPGILALLLAAITVGFSVSAFESIILFLSGQVTRKNYSKIVIATGLSLLWAVTITLSIMSTIIGQYDKSVEKKRMLTMSGISMNKENWNLLQEQKKDLRSRLNDDRLQIDSLNKLVSGMSDIKSRTENNSIWDNTQYRIKLVNRDIEKLTEELDKVREKEKEQLKQAKSIGLSLNSEIQGNEIPNFYGWIAKMFKLDEDKVQFWISIFPAIFVDFVSPTSLGICLFLRNRYKKSKTHKKNIKNNKN